MNDRGQPVIHDIASKLGCIRPSPDLPFAFPEGAEGFAELQAQLQAARASLDDNGRRKHSEDSAYSSPAMDRTERASSSESDSDDVSSEYNQQQWSQQQQQRSAKAIPPAIKTEFKPTSSKLAQQTSMTDKELQHSARTSYDAAGSLPSPIYTDFTTESPMFRNASPFSPWSAGDDFLGQPHALDFTSNYISQQQFQMPRPSPLSSRPLGSDSDALKAMQVNDGLNFADGTIRPNMLDCNTGYDLNDQMDSIIFTGADYEPNLGMV